MVGLLVPTKHVGPHLITRSLYRMFQTQGHIEKIFNDNLEVKQQVLESLIDYDFNTQNQIEYK